MRRPRPRVLAVTRRTLRKNKYIDYLGEYHLDLLISVGILPVMIPVVKGTMFCLSQYMEGMAGLLLVEGEDIEPRRYRARQADVKHTEDTHGLKDDIEICLTRHALRHDLPILAICRGSQLVNVVCGGTLYGDVQEQKRSRVKHRDPDHYDTYRHLIRLLPGTPLRDWYRRKTIRVNSYHHQGIRRLADRFQPMAYAEDGLVEGYYDPQAAFLVGLQFHPERMLMEYPGNRRVWRAFGSAVRRQFTTA
jgi:gamma-glutamyl-gamma-aminobutyrate hydrolase PuuD